jgi:hypothetical protein
MGAAFFTSDFQNDQGNQKYRLHRPPPGHQGFLSHPIVAAARLKDELLQASLMNAMRKPWRGY